MQWIIEGADGRSGDELSVTVEAESRAHAEAIARGRGMLVSLVYRAESPADALAAMLGEPAPQPEPAAEPAPKPRMGVPPTATVVQQADAGTVGYASPMANAPRRPVYDLHLKLAGFMLAGLCVPAYLLGLVLVVSSIATLLSMVRSGYALGAVASMSMLASAFVPLVIGAALHAAAAACFALREIARSRTDAPG